MSDPAFFGYGSLVNLATHAYDDPRPARLHGWRRVWRHTSLREVAFLSVEPAAGSAIDGVIARVPRADWQALDTREAAYDRHDVTDAILHDGAPAPTAVYQVSPQHVMAPSQDHPILLSYIDVVVQGYLRMYGDKGATAFFQTTSGWDTPIVNDRSAPRYPRAQTLSSAETAFVDWHLAQVSTTV